ncbi:MAG: hypothetical protein GX589_05090 [Deltaproteobacteria bacterium]|nr:hypothetical protein [Deltaproteobacteria bacterium]
MIPIKNSNAYTNDHGIVIVATLLLILVLLSMVAAHHFVTNIELATTKATSNSAQGFFAAEAGLNLRAEEIRATFMGYNRPSGTSPSELNPCTGGNTGSGDFRCKSYSLGKHRADTYVLEAAGNPINTVIPPGELYQNLSAQEYRYSTRSVATNSARRTEAMLELRFKSRLVPMFQFMAFYDKDLEILPGRTMTLSGPVHTNGDLYLNTQEALNIKGQVTTAGSLYRGRKNNSVCDSKPVKIMDPAAYRTLLNSCSSRTKIQKTSLNPWNGMIRTGVDILDVPPPEDLNPGAGNTYWDAADLRLVLRLTSAGAPDYSNSPSGVEVRNANNSVDAGATASLHGCAGTINGRPVGTSNTFYNNREGGTIRMLEINMIELLNCIQSTNSSSSPKIMGGKALSDTTEGGLVWHLTVSGPHSAGQIKNLYGVRVRNAARLQSNLSGAALVKGITLVSDQAFYVGGNFNSYGKIPAAVLCDSFNILSSAWNFNDAASTKTLSNRVAGNTTVNAAVLSGTDTTGGVEGSGGQSLGAYNGGLENYPRFHEHWGGKTLTYRGSFVSLNVPRHVDGWWVYGNPQYEAPIRDWDYDTDFNDAAKLPPMSPRFVYLRQELFVRDFEQ